MPRTTLPRIAAVEAMRPFMLRVRWADGGENAIDVTGPIEAFRVFAPLRADPAMFEAVKVGDYGSLGERGLVVRQYNLKSKGQLSEVQRRPLTS